MSPEYGVVSDMADDVMRGWRDCAGVEVEVRRMYRHCAMDQAGSTRAWRARTRLLVALDRYCVAVAVAQAVGATHVGGDIVAARRAVSRAYRGALQAAFARGQMLGELVAEVRAPHGEAGFGDDDAF